MDIVGYHVVPYDGDPLFVPNWTEAVSIAEFLCEWWEKQGLIVTRECVSESQCRRETFVTYCRYDGGTKTIVVECIRKRESRL